LSSAAAAPATPAAVARARAREARGGWRRAVGTRARAGEQPADPACGGDEGQHRHARKQAQRLAEKRQLTLSELDLAGT